jgi:hypothetical protein
VGAQRGAVSPGSGEFAWRSVSIASSLVRHCGSCNVECGYGRPKMSTLLLTSVVLGSTIGTSGRRHSARSSCDDGWTCGVIGLAVKRKQAKGDCDAT